MNLNTFNHHQLQYQRQYQQQYQQLQYQLQYQQQYQQLHEQPINSKKRKRECTGISFGPPLKKIVTDQKAMQAKTEYQKKAQWYINQSTKNINVKVPHILSEAANGINSQMYLPIYEQATRFYITGKKLNRTAALTPDTVEYTRALELACGYMEQCMKSTLDSINETKNIIYEKRKAIMLQPPLEILPIVASFLTDISPLNNIMLENSNYNNDLKFMLLTSKSWRSALAPFVRTCSTAHFTRCEQSENPKLRYLKGHWGFLTTTKLGDCMREDEIRITLETAQKFNRMQIEQIGNRENVGVDDSNAIDESDESDVVVESNDSNAIDNSLDICIGSSLTTFSNLFKVTKQSNYRIRSICVVFKEWNVSSCALDSQLQFPQSETLHIIENIQSSEERRQFYQTIFHSTNSPRVMISAHKFNNTIPGFCFYASDMIHMKKWIEDIQTSMQWEYWMEEILSCGFACFVLPFKPSQDELNVMDLTLLTNKREKQLTDALKEMFNGRSIGKVEWFVGDFPSLMDGYTVVGFRFLSKLANNANVGSKTAI